MHEGELHVVPGERHIERLARDGILAETRTSLRSRLAAALLPDVAFVGRRECRLVLTMALSDPDTGGAGQLALFGGVAQDAGPRAAVLEAHGDALLRLMRARGGASWARMIVALDDAIGVLRARGGTPDHLDRVGKARGFLASRARTLATATRALDARLARAGACDERLAGALIAREILDLEASRVEELLGARRLRARWLLSWEPSDLVWWRALDDKLAPRGGGARVVLPTFDRPFAASRERDPLDALADEVARGLDGPAEGERIEPVLGDLTGRAGDVGTFVRDPARVRIVSAPDAIAQARAVTSAVSDALASGASVERIAIAFPVLSERTLSPLRRALEDSGIVAYEARGVAPSESPVIAAALLALDAAASLDRHAVARLLRSGWVDAPRLAGDSRDAVRRIARIARIARTLETSATAAGENALTRLVRTATPRSPRRGEDDAEHADDVVLVTRLATMLAGAQMAATRIEHLRAARSLWTGLGIGARAGRGGLASFTSDAVPAGVPRAERLAIARDARAWDTLITALDLYETTAHRVAALDQRIDAAAFRLELVELLDAAASQPGGGRAAAVRIASLADIAGDVLDLLIVVDANEGVLPRDDARDTLISESLAEAIAKASRNAFVAPSPGATRARELTALALAAGEAARVVLAFSREDAAGAPLAPSTVVDVLVRAGVPLVPTEALSIPRSGVDVRVRVARERAREGFFLDAARPPSDVVGDLAPSALAAALLVEETGGAARPLAVTGLERFARCGFMGYAHVVLGARETDEKSELPDAREEGTVIHEALASAFLATRELWARRPRPAEEILALGQAAAADVLHRWQGHAPLRAVVRLAVADAVTAALRAAIEDLAWDFILAEQPFGGRSTTESWAPLDLSEDDVRLTLRGTIDRIDRAHDGLALRVIDYKRSRVTVQRSAAALGEMALQVPLYACAASRELGLPATGAYVPTHVRDVTTGTRPNPKVLARMDELVARFGGALAEVERRALGVVAQTRAGGLMPIPAAESECRLCAVSGGCRKPRFAMAPNDENEDEAWKPAGDVP